jgi:hypothetical protein
MMDGVAFGTGMGVQRSIVVARMPTVGLLRHDCLEREELVSALLSGGGQPVQQLGPQFRVGVMLGWGGDYVLYLCGVPVVQLKDNMIEFGSLIADAGQRELSLGLGEPQGWPIGPERQKAYCHSRYLC